MVDRAEHASERRPVAHPRVEEPKRRRRGSEPSELLRATGRDDGLLVARRDEGEVLLAVVVEAERRRLGRRPRRSGCSRAETVIGFEVTRLHRRSTSLSRYG